MNTDVINKMSHFHSSVSRLSLETAVATHLFLSRMAAEEKCVSVPFLMALSDEYQSY